MEASFQSLFNRIASGETVTITDFDRSGVNSLQASVRRKFKRYKEALSALGVDSLDGRYVLIQYDASTREITLRLADESEKANASKIFSLKEL